MIKKLEDIGFYTLSDARCMGASLTSPLMRCEMILTDRCNFNCRYCRGLRADCQGDMPGIEAFETLRLWCDQNLKNVRFSGGEPTLYPHLGGLVSYCASHGVERIAISTNGSADIKQYIDLVDRGVNDFSISLDSACCSVSSKINDAPLSLCEEVVANIRRLRLMYPDLYITVGMVFTEDNLDGAVEAVLFAANVLKVSDIRVIPSAQFNQALTVLSESEKIMTLLKDNPEKFPILRYRLSNIRLGNLRHVRGLGPNDSPKCVLALDDMAVAGKWHFPCIIYMREGGEPIGRIDSGKVREERYEWAAHIHNSLGDPICRNNCLDVCIDYNNKCRSLRV